MAEAENTTLRTIMTIKTKQKMKVKLVEGFFFKNRQDYQHVVNLVLETRKIDNLKNITPIFENFWNLILLQSL